MYRRPKFLEILLQIREQMARDADYDVDRFAQMIRSGGAKDPLTTFSLKDPDAVAGSGRKTKKPEQKP